MRKILIALIILLILILACGNNPTKVVIKGLDDEDDAKTTPEPKISSTELKKTTILFLIKNEQDLQDVELFALDLKDINLKSKGITLKIIPEEKKPDLVELKKYDAIKLLSMSKITEGDYDEVSFNIAGVLHKKAGSDSSEAFGGEIKIPIKLNINPKENYAVVLNYLPKDSLKETTTGLILNSKAELIIYESVNVVINSDRTVDLNDAEEVFRKKI